MRFSIKLTNKLKRTPFQVTDVFAFEADPNERLMEIQKESFISQGRLPNFAENTNAILDIYIYNIAKSRRKPIHGLELLEDSEKYAREIHSNQKLASNVTSNLDSPDRLLNVYRNGTFPTSFEEHMRGPRESMKSLLGVLKKGHYLRNKKGLKVRFNFYT